MIKIFEDKLRVKQDWFEARLKELYSEFSEELRESRKSGSKRTNLSKYGMKLSDYEDMLVKQDYRCKLCRQHEAHFSNGLVVDHSHKTGEVRGLLCPKCNSGLGFFDDDTFKLLRAIQYLQGEL